MAKVTFITADGTETVVENAEGSLMEIGKDNGVDGIDGDCGGVCSCATCRVRVRAEWIERVGQAEEAEQDLLELEDATAPGDRLGCQVELTAELDGLVVDVPER